MADQAGIDLGLIEGTGPGGRIGKDDVEQAIATGSAGPAATTASTASPGATPAPSVAPVTGPPRLEAKDVEADGPGILATRLHADGEHRELLFVDGGPSTTGEVGKLRMKGREVFRHAVVNLADVLKEVLEDASVDAADVDWVVPHQANARILDATARKLNLAPEKVIVTVDQHANTSAASVPLALDVAKKDGRIKPGDLVMFEAMGGGFTWGASLARM